MKVQVGPIVMHQEFIIMNEQSTYNAILGRPWIHELKARPSTYDQATRFSLTEGIMEVIGNQATTREYFMIHLIGHSSMSEDVQAERNRDVSYGSPKQKQTSEDMDYLDVDRQDPASKKVFRIYLSHRELDRRRIIQAQSDKIQNACMFCTQDEKTMIEKKENRYRNIN